MTAGTLTGEDTEGSAELRIRGASTLVSDARPLIIVDNFPFEGDIRSINPNDVESVTILRDASAASIWGAKAGNGVIVINMKQGSYQKPPEISAMLTSQWIAKPDLFYDRSVLLPTTVMDFQKQLFEANAYPETDISIVPAYVELLIKKRDGRISAEDFETQEQIYRSSDIRRDALEHIYRTANQQQYSMVVRGGEKQYRYNITGGYIHQDGRIVGQKNSSRNISLQNGIRLGRFLELDGVIRYSGSTNVSNNMQLSVLGNENMYLPLVDKLGSSLPVVRSSQSLRYAYQERAVENGLLDWMYRPVDELQENRITQNSGLTTLSTNLTYRMPIGLDFRLSYMLANGRNTAESLYSEKSYFARDLINTFTQQNGSLILPLGGVWRQEPGSVSRIQSLRFQSNYSRDWENRLQLDVLAGVEGTDNLSRSSTSFTLYGYDSYTESGIAQNMFGREQYWTRPNGYMALIPTPYTAPNKMVNRLLSLYGNMGFTMLNKYILSGSLRWDGSNLLGVNTNERGTALWSIGGSWRMDKESFMSETVFSSLKLRATYGSSGNINKTLGHLPVITRRNDTRYQLPYAILSSPGNPSLRWEQVDMINLGMDWGLSNLGLNGSVEWYNKDAKHLLSSMAIDPTIGVSANYMQNYANMLTRGLDFSVSHTVRWLDFLIQSNLLINYATSKVTKVKSTPFRFINDYMTSRYFLEGESPDVIYSIPWHGLDGETGLPLYYNNDGSEVTNYLSYYEGLKIDDINRSGVKVAPWFGAFRLNIGWKQLQLSSLFNYNFGHVARMRSYAPGAELTRTGHTFYHMDYYDRWQKPGDEELTHVPATNTKYDINLIRLYQYSEVHIVPLDHVRLQDLTLSIGFDSRLLQRTKIKHLDLVMSGTNLGIIWKKTDRLIHPQFPLTDFPASRQFNIGLRANL